MIPGGRQTNVLIGIVWPGVQAVSELSFLCRCLCDVETQRIQTKLMSFIRLRVLNTVKETHGPPKKSYTALVAEKWF